MTNLIKMHDTTVAWHPLHVQTREVIIKLITFTSWATLPIIVNCYHKFPKTARSQGSLSRSGSWTRSPQRGLDSGESSPHGSSSRCSTSNMTTASTQKTEAMPTKDALFGRKKKDIRVFPDFTAGSESVLPRGITKNGYSVFDEVSHPAYRIF